MDRPLFWFAAAVIGVSMAAYLALLLAGRTDLADQWLRFAIPIVTSLVAVIVARHPPAGRRR